MSGRVYVWDLPTRLFHWLLVVLIAAAYLTASFDAMDWHRRIGLTLLGLLVFRLVWGFVGSRHARFAEFLRGPAVVLAYLRGAWHGVGHNPLGGWSVLLLLLLPLAMVGSGLFANDDVAFQGPLAALVDKASSDRLTSLHHLAFDLLLGLIGLHLAAIAYYRLARRENLVKPMFSGWKEGDFAEEQPRRPARWPALLLAVVVAGGVVYGVTTLEPPPPKPIPAEALPDW
ncbi:MAG: cytochrome b/b6 domain-containing protein [Thiobacillaceae bacterium]|jgi:cytochrome b|nr:cytochrome b/b6 domain-containing protein [Thiobacillaceae bacterium]